MIVINSITALAGALQNAYREFNDHCFGGVLPEAVISFEPGKKKHAFGWFYTVKTWETDGGSKYGIVIASDYLDRPIEAIYCTLVHEMCHLYATEQGIQDTSRSGTYHNNKFKEIALNAGLTVEKVPEIGWTTPELSDSLKAWISGNLPELDCKIVFNLPEQSKPKNPKKKNGYFVYICPYCERKVRATSKLFITCGGAVGDVHAPADMELETE